MVPKIVPLIAVVFVMSAGVVGGTLTVVLCISVTVVDDCTYVDLSLEGELFP